MSPTLGEVFRVIDLAGVFGNAVLGGIVATEERLDPIGFAALAILSGLGGGLIRDTLLQHGPPVALTDYLYLVTAIAGGVVAFLVPVYGRTWNLTLPVIDAIALGTWAVAGAQKTLGIGMGWAAALLMGTITAVGGGTLRDIAVRRTPQIFGGNTLYATCAVIASGVVVLFAHYGQATVGAVVATVVGAVLCLVARWRGWQLTEGPAWHYALRRPPGKRLPRITLRVNSDDSPLPLVGERRRPRKR
ncbi:trimeric intracellular cation channel family protein [Mycobacterium gastri]|uniref:trimeric intracellular cation channel family protein n=1 Tax=Mycobacterium gastri TaxID=1777 RepID=UPI0003E4E257|nr:trimeric intracellular cation channel family protein [Mycobacterium gastri]ETW26480.1 membrane protein [Mycobacterium gastri 'Wayne']